MAGSVIACVGVLALVIIWLPTFVGCSRGVNACWLLAMINLLFGWTIVGWLFCLLWAVVGQTKAADAFYRANGRA